MKHIHKSLVAAAALFVAGCQAQLAAPGPIADESGETRYMREYGVSLPPAGYVEFCEREPGECARRASAGGRLVMTPQRWAVLNEVNTEVNRAVVAATDEEIYQTAEHWTLPDVAGDCEDYVLAKRKQLIDRGFPQSALLITVVRDEDRLGHAVLTVASDMGDLVLDNKSDLIRPWSDTNYVYYKRQSRSDPQRWVALTPKAGTSTALAAIDAGRASHTAR